MGPSEGPFGPPHLTQTPKKQKNKNKKNKTTKTKENKKSKNKNKRTRKPNNTKIPKKELFNYQSIFSFVFGGCPKFSFLDNLAKKARTQKHYKNRGFSKAFFEKQICVTKRPFLDKKIPSSEIPVIILFCLFSLSTTKTPKLTETPIFVVFFCKPKKR